jgi:hypothetical protein
MPALRLQVEDAQQADVRHLPQLPGEGAEQEGAKMKKKLCPLRKTVTKGFLVVEADTFGECIGEECAWFDLFTKSCSVWVLAHAAALKAVDGDA